MRQLSIDELNKISGQGIAKFIIPVVAGFIFGGPAGALAVAGTFVATTGIDNLEYLHKNDTVPTVGEIFR